jgi:Zn-dependent protease with chaperone function
MARYENPQIPEGINVSEENPLKEFALLVTGISVAIIVVVTVLSLLAGHLARYVPFAQERALLSHIDVGWLKEKPDGAPRQKEQYLQSLADRLAKAMDLPADVQVTIHYDDASTINAMATLGGHIVVYQGLIDTLPNENALAMVVAHEMAHIRHRHPIVAMGRGFAVMLALTSLAGMGDSMMQQWVGNMGMLSVLTFSRAQEEEADADAIAAVQRSYGHVGGAAAFFENIAAQPATLKVPQMLSTHPDHAARIERIRRFEREHPATGSEALVPLPDFLVCHR